jgi:hypothetical protein
VLFSKDLWRNFIVNFKIQLRMPIDGKESRHCNPFLRPCNKIRPCNKTIKYSSFRLCAEFYSCSAEKEMCHFHSYPIIVQCHRKLLF